MTRTRTRSVAVGPGPGPGALHRDWRGKLKFGLGSGSRHNTVTRLHDATGSAMINMIMITRIIVSLRRAHHQVPLATPGTVGPLANSLIMPTVTPVQGPGRCVDPNDIEAAVHIELSFQVESDHHDASALTSRSDDSARITDHDDPSHVNLNLNPPPQASSCL
jgi:hypothetical protein